MERKKLDDAAVSEALSNLNGWTLDGGKLYKKYVFQNFVSAFSFMAGVALIAESMNHHPNWCNVYNQVQIHLETHELGGISDLDITLAEKMDALAAPLVPD